MLLARALLTAVAAVAATASLAAADAAPTRHDRSPDPAASVTAAPSRPPLPAVSERAVDPTVLASIRSAPPAASGVTQVVRIDVVGGGLTIDRDADTIPLAPTDDPRVWTAPLPPLRVVDARGTFEGWRARWRVASLTADGAPAAGNVEVDTTVAVVHGLAGGLGDGHGRVLASAHRQWGAGTYEVSGTVTVRLGANADPTGVVVDLGYGIG